MTAKRSFLPTLEEIEALERQLAGADPPPDADALERIETYKNSVRKRGRYLRFVPIIGAFGTLLVDSAAPWWSTALAAILFVGAGWLWAERLALVRYRQLIERELPPPDPVLQLTAAAEGGAMLVSALSPRRDSDGEPEESMGRAAED